MNTARDRLKQRLAGVAFFLVPLLLIWLSVAVYNKDFTTVDTVTLRTSNLGNEMHPYADVKLHGVRVGEVRSISANGTGATLKLAIDPDKVKLLPANVSAQFLPTTLFGERYVALIPPADPSPARLTAHSVIDEDHSANAVELQAVLNNLMPLLTAVKPAELSVTLTALSQALQGRGAQIGQTLVTLDGYLKKFNPNLPSLNDDIKQLANLADVYKNATPDFLQALDDFTVTAKTIVDQQTQLNALYSAVTSSGQELTTFLRANSDTIIRLSADSTSTLEVLAKYSPELPCTLKSLVRFEPLMDKILGKGTKQPGLHVDVTTVPSKGRYVPGRDHPAYNDKGGPHCYSDAVAYGTANVKGALGLPNSPQENELVNELIAPSAGQTPEDLPDWSSVLVGPLFRGTEVKVK